MAYHLACFPGKSTTTADSAFKATREGACSGNCGQPIKVGQPIAWYRRGGKANAYQPRPAVCSPPAEGLEAIVQATPDMGPFGPIIALVAEACKGAIMPELFEEIAAAVANVVPRPVVHTIQVLDNNAGPAIPVALGVQHVMFPRLLQACSARGSKGHRLNVWCAGPAAAGKTTAAENVALALDLNYYSTGSISDPIELLGFIDAGGTYHRTLLREAYEHGGIFLFDEIDNSDPRALVALNALLANGIAAFPDGMIKRHKDTVIVAAANTWGHGATNDYVSRMKQDAALMDRFVRLDWNYDEALEMAISPDKGVCAHVQKIRAAIATKGLKVLCTPRATLNVCGLMSAGMALNDALDMAIYNGMPAASATAIRDMVN